MTEPEPPLPNTSRGITSGQLGLYALLLAVVASVVAVIPPAAPFTWLPAIPSIALGVLGFRRGQSKHTSAAAVAVSVLALVIAIVATGVWYFGWFG